MNLIEISKPRQYLNSMQAWESINEDFILNPPRLYAEVKRGALYVNNVTLVILDPKVDPEFDFGRHFNYTKSKWNSLVSNYIDYEQLENIKLEVEEEEAKKSKIYNLAIQFDNKHSHGKNCLLSMVFSRKCGIEQPVITVFLRASEITKRLICDLLLFQRIGEYVYGDIKFSIVIHCNQMFNDDTVLLMYHAHKDIKKLIIYHSKQESELRKIQYLTRYKELNKKLDKLLTCDPDSIKYKVHKRALKVLRPDLFRYPVTLAKDCKLFK